MKHLGEMENLGFRLRDSGKYQEAIEIFEKIIAENPNYEWGACFMHIAGCYEYLGEFAKAKEYYLKSMEYDDTDDTRVGNYASFLFAHEPKEAFKWYLYWLYLKKETSRARQTILADLSSLAKKIGISEKELQSLINDKDAAERFIKTA